MDATKPCPFCAENIAAAAVRCPHCRSRLTVLDPEQWHRDHAGRRVAGVASAVAVALAVPVGLVRLGFVFLSFVHLLGPMLYAALWLLIPAHPGGTAPFGRGLERAKRTADVVRAAFRGAGAPQHPAHTVNGTGGTSLPHEAHP